MAIRALHNVANNFGSTWAATVLVGGASGVVVAPTAAYPSVPFKVTSGTERIRVSSVTVDTPSAGQDTWAITRGEDGTTAAQHGAGSAVTGYADAHDYMELKQNLTACRALIAAMMGVPVGDSVSGVQATSSADDLKVVAQGTPDMTVRVMPGAGVASGEPIALVALYDTAAMTAPAANPRIDVIEIDQDGAVNVVTGAEAGSPSAPAVTAGSMKLAEVYHRVGSTSIEDADDASNSYITDARTFL